LIIELEGANYRAIGAKPIEKGADVFVAEVSIFALERTWAPGAFRIVGQHHLIIEEVAAHIDIQVDLVEKGTPANAIK
jgi:hypothetical protein